VYKVCYRVGVSPIGPIWRNSAPRSSEIRALVVFLKIRSVLPHKALGLISYLNFEKSMEDFAKKKEKSEKNVIRFDMV